MNIRANFNQYFEDILSTLRSMEEHAKIFSKLSTLSDELAQLESYIKITFETLDNQYENYIQHVNLLSDLVDFQRKVIRFKTPEEMTPALFDFLKSHIPYDQAFIYLKLGDDEEGYELITQNQDQKQIRKFLEHSDLSAVDKLIHNRDLGLLLTETADLKDKNIPWNLLKATSAIIFPVRVKDHYLGFGMLAREKESFLISHLSFVNLTVGLLSLLIFQHFYFSRLRNRLFKQFRMKKALEEIKYAEYLEKGPLIIFTLDPRGTVLHINASALEKIQLDQDFVMGEKFFNLLPPEHRKPFQEIIQEMGEGDVRFYKCPLRCPSGAEFILEFYIFKMDLQEHFPLVNIFAINATQEYYKELQDHHKEILDELTQFSKIINGSINNLLTVMVPNVSLVEARLPEDHELQKYLKRMEDQLSQTAQMVQKFLNYDLPRLEQPTPGDLNKTIKEIINRLSSEFPGEVEFKFSLDPSIPNMILYPRRLHQLFKILAQNSLDALDGNGRIKISTKLINLDRDGLLVPQNFFLSQGHYVEILFEDNGTGIEPRILPHVFKPFFSTKIKNEGMGLGLFIAYNIVRDLKGEIFVRSQPKVFTRIFIYLPLQEEPEIREVLPGIEEKPEEVPPAILVVDDEYNIRSMLKEILEMNGYQVYTAANGQEGIDIFRENSSKIELVILDMVMPVMDGKAAFAEIKKLKPSQKVLIISGYAQKEDLEEIFRRGITGFMRKPFQISEILARVKELIKKRAR